MSFFNSVEPVLRQKQDILDVQDHIGLWQIRWQMGAFAFTRLYTRIDQIFVLWGLIIAVIFGIAQFSPVSWTLQALLWSGLTIAGTITMTILAWFWVTAERLRWVVYGWAGLMLLGTLLTDLGIFAGWWQILLYLCPLWLGLSAIGYFITGLGMRSRTFLFAAVLHLLGIVLLPSVSNWQFLATGAVMVGCLLFLSEVQWDMRPPIDYSLTLEQKRFNQEQHQRRLALGTAE